MPARGVLPITYGAQVTTTRVAELASQLKAGIAAARLQPGDKLPTYRQIMSQFGVPKKAVAAAFGLLAEQGIVVTPAQGKGTFVA